MSYTDLADEVRLSPNAAAERVRKLVARGVISRFTAELDPRELGLSMSATIEVRVAPGREPAKFEEMALGVRGVAEVAHVTGPADFLLQVRCRDTQDLDRLLHDLKSDGSVASTETRLVLHRSRSANPFF